MLEHVHQLANALPVLRPLGDRTTSIHLLSVRDLGSGNLSKFRVLLVLHNDSAGRPQVLLALREAIVNEVVSDHRELLLVRCPLPDELVDPLPRQEPGDGQVVHDVINVLMVIDLHDVPVKPPVLGVHLQILPAHLGHLPCGYLRDGRVDDLRVKS
jgi:hypothetical protein